MGASAGAVSFAAVKLGTSPVGALGVVNASATALVGSCPHPLWVPFLLPWMDWALPYPLLWVLLVWGIALLPLVLTLGVWMLIVLLMPWSLPDLLLSLVGKVLLVWLDLLLILLRGFVLFPVPNPPLWWFVDNIDFYQRRALVCRFAGFSPSLPDLHCWVSDSWKPLVAHNIELFPCAKGFFIASFTSFLNRDSVLGKLWAWGDHSLSVKPWTTSFNPLTKPLNVHPVWVHLPNLPLHFWEHSCYKAISNSIGYFSKVDDAMSSMGHSTFACI